MSKPIALSASVTHSAKGNRFSTFGSKSELKELRQGNLRKKGITR